MSPDILSNSDDSRIGAWIVALGNAIQDGDTSAKDDFDTIFFASRAARFYSAIRSLPSINASRLAAYRLEGRLSSLELAIVLNHLSDLGVAELARSVDGSLFVAAMHAASIPSVFSFAAYVLNKQERNVCADVALGILDETIHIPRHENALVNDISTQYHVETKQIAVAIRHLAALGAIVVTRETDGGEPIIYNPLEFSDTNHDAMKLLATLGTSKREEVLQIVDHVRNHPGVPVPPNLRGISYSVLKQTGIIDASSYSPKVGELSHEFPTMQNAWSRISFANNKGASSDLVHDAKALLASIRYGQHFASTGGGRIWSPLALLAKLMSTGSIGPASNIGSDYNLIARRGIVNIVENPQSIGRYSMELVKQDVLQPVLELIKLEASDQINGPDDPGSGNLYSFSPPEFGRRETLSEEIAVLRDEIIFVQLLHRR